MSGFGGFSGFGQNNNNQTQNTGFGGFGQAANTNTGFGSTSNNTGFGGTGNATGGLFGSTSGGFGNSGGFGTPQASTGFGAKPAGFGTPASTAGTSLFGSNTATAGTGFGGFGSTNTNTSSPFGSNNNTAGGGLFGAKPAFGAATSTPSFGGSTTTTGFGASAGFGGAGGALGGSTESQGTGAVPFAPTVEKEPNSTTNQQNSFQSICFQQPYQKFSPEELRLADYAQGRKTGNGSAGATGAFGQTNFGGFGSTATTGGFGSGSGTTGGGLFGSTTPATGAFGSQPATGAFGSGTTGGGLFGAKPATSGLFGSTPAAQPSGGLFGNTAATTGFGSTPTNTGAFGSTGTTGGLFGTNNSAQKPFSFGNTPQPAASTGGFGSTPSTTGAFGGGGLFGNNTQTQQNTPSAFGTNTTAGNTGGGGLFGSSGFGNNAAQQQNTGSSLFGNQPKPATGGLFGASPAPASGGLFGNSQSTNTNPFGGAQTGASGGLFGGAKPATGATGGLFGGTTAANTGGGLFGGSFGSNANQNQQNTGSSLFGNSSNNQAKPSLFSGSTQNQGGLFGSGTTTGLFGSSLNNNNATQQQQQQPQQPSIFGGSAFGGSQQGGNQSQSLTASINDPAAFGTSSMFSNLASPEIHNPGPIATPLSSLSKQKKPGVLPMYKLNPASASRFTTPQKRGFGFSYSTYGTPGSASSTSSTPLNFGGSMLGSSLSRGLSKSMSTSSLRGSYNSSSFNREDSILAPGAFSASPGSRFNSTGSMKKLVINRSIRTDLFSPPPKDSSPAPVATSERGILKKRVSFDTTTVGGNTNGSILSGTSSPLKQVQSSTNPAPEDAGFLRSSRTNGNGSKSNGASLQPEMEQVKGNELAIVPEEEAAAPAPKVRAKTVNQEDQEPGRYWMRPSREEILAMNRIQRSKVSNFMVGREGVGQVEFSVPVDLNNINLDEIYGKIVILETRQATVYPDPSKKPPMGKGLNVPSRIQLQNSWPRGKDKRQPTSEKVGPRFQKHIERLSRVPDTKFVDYNKDTGVWTFTVEHFTTYGLEYDEDETDGEGISEFDQSTLSAPPDTPTPQSRTPKSRHLDQSFVSNSEMSVVTESDPDDTFDFKKHKVILPGAFDNQEVFEQDAEMDDEYESEHQSFLDERSVGSQSENEVEEPMDDDDVFNDRELVRIEDIEMAGSYPNPDGTAEHEDEYSQGENDRESMPETPGAAMRARMRAMKSSGTPSKRKLQLEDDGWTETLQRTISPRKQDRAELKRLRDSVMLGDTDEPAPVPRNRVVSDGRGFATSIDLMHSLFGETKSPIKSPAKIAKLPAKANGFEWPYSQKSKSSNINESDMSSTERAFHDSLKPRWGPDGILVYAASARPLSKSSRRNRERDGLLVVQKGGVISEGRDVRFANFSNESSAESLKKQKSLTLIEVVDGIPLAKLEAPFKYSDMFEGRAGQDPATAHEKLVWELASVLFEPLDVPVDLEGVPGASERLRKDNLSAFWQKLVEQSATRDVAMAKSSEEKAIASLSGHRIPEACQHLLAGKNFHLATLIALIGGSESVKRDIREQLNEWQKSRVLSEISQPIRALYEFLAGNVLLCDGAKGAPIEDRVETFVVSERFGLDWRRAFGLRLWYAITSTEGIETAVKKFAEDLKQDKETAKPFAWYVEQNISPLWDDQVLETREDLLWGLLKLFADPQADLEAVLRPENSQLSPLNFRMSWQLSRALTAFGRCSYGVGADEKADQLTLSFASQLTNEGNWLDAAFVLLHLSSSKARSVSIQELLAHHADRIGSEDSKAFVTLTRDFCIPATWLWEAKALYMRSVLKDSRREVEYLLRAGAYVEAHRTFSKDVAPTAVVERDWETLRALLAGFRGKEQNIPEWRLGGELYVDYLDILEVQKKGLSNLNSQTLERLFAALPAMVEHARHASFLEIVAVQDISGVLAKLVVELGAHGQTKNLPKVLRLPLTEDKYLKHTNDLSLGYYKSVMATGR